MQDKMMQYRGIVRLNNADGDSPDHVELAAEFGPPFHYNAQLFDESLEKPLLVSSYVHIPQALLEATIHNRMQPDDTIDMNGDIQLICAYNEMMLMHTMLQEGIIQPSEVPPETQVPVSYSAQDSFSDFLKNDPHVPEKPVDEAIARSPDFLLELMFLATKRNYLTHEDIMANKAYEESLVPL